MREVLFRGKRVDNGEWVYGYLFKIWEKAYILWGTTNGVPNMIEVIPETVGQFTGLTDKNGTKIFEGVILRNEYGILYEILFDTQKGYVLRKINTKWLNISKENDYITLYYLKDFVEVIGNIHEKGK